MIPKELSRQSIEKVYKKIKPFINVTSLIKASQIVDEDLILSVPITFTPRNLIKYNEIITLDINNGLHKVDLEIKGEGVPLELKL